MSNKIDLQISDQVSPTFCAAKWTQVTLHLQTGYTHSCHHPRMHPIGETGLKENHAMLHNTPFKISQRKLMMEGKRPEECAYCWKAEDSGAISDRHIKTNSDWSKPFVDEIVKDPYNPRYKPKYVEISFGNLCNFKCSYCQPNFSSEWQDEIEKLGGYPTSTNYNAIFWQAKKFYKNNEYNPYVDAWWQWYDELIDELMVLRITGGEPFLNKNLYQLLEKLLHDPKPNLTLALNSNLCVPKKVHDKVFEMVSQLLKNKCIKRFELYTSAEAFGAKAEYIRWGLNYDEWKQNLLKWGTELDDIRINIMSTFNLLSVTSYLEFLTDILKAKHSFNKTNQLYLDIPYLRYPEHQTAWLAPPYYRYYIVACLEYMKANSNNHPAPGFWQSEILKMERLLSILDQEWNDANWFDKYQTQRNDFVSFVDEHDRRRGSNFLATFPEMKSFYESIKSEQDGI
jgi:organic radical activating enzyme